MVFWSQGMWDLGSLTRDQTLTPFPALEGKGLTTGLPGKSHATLNSEYHLLCARPRSGRQKNSSRQNGENSLPGAYILVREVGGKQKALQLSRVSVPECCAEIRRRGHGVKYSLDFFIRPLVLPQADTHAHMCIYTHACLCHGGSEGERCVGSSRRW